MYWIDINTQCRKPNRIERERTKLKPQSQSDDESFIKTDFPNHPCNNNKNKNNNEEVQSLSCCALCSEWIHTLYHSPSRGEQDIHHTHSPARGVLSDCQNSPKQEQSERGPLIPAMPCKHMTAGMSKNLIEIRSLPQQVLPKVSKLVFVKGFGEEICKLLVRRAV
jgi:hypothetical protein